MCITLFHIPWKQYQVRKELLANMLTMSNSVAFEILTSRTKQSVFISFFSSNTWIGSQCKINIFYEVLTFFCFQDCERYGTGCLEIIGARYYLNNAYLTCTSQNGTCYKKTFVLLAVAGKIVCVPVFYLLSCLTKCLNIITQFLACTGTVGKCMLSIIHIMTNSPSYKPRFTNKLNSGYSCVQIFHEH